MMSSKFVNLALVALIGLATSGCGIGKALGDNKNAPDEFAIATKAPLALL
jgi:hypothetical protein